MRGDYRHGNGCEWRTPNRATQGVSKNTVSLTAAIA